MRIEIPAFVRECMHLLEDSGHGAYLVGGCLRDCLREKTPADWDIATTALPDRMIADIGERVRILPTGKKHGTLTFLGTEISVEVTTMRKDGAYTDHRRPDTVDFTTSLTDDLARRDFTVNAMAYNSREGLIDPFGGRDDLSARVLRCVGDPRLRFEEDALRILRLFRFASALGFTPEAKALAGAKERRDLLCAVSAERVSSELSKLIVGQDALTALRLMVSGGVLEAILPAFGPAIGFDQKSSYHDRTVDEHSFAALAFAPPVHDLRLALLLHDIGKPAVARVDENGRGHYKGHAGVGAKMAAKILRELRYPRKTAVHVEKLIALHQIKIPLDPAVIRQLIGDHGVGFVRDLMQVKRADNRAKSPICAPRREHYEKVGEMVEEIIASGDCLTLAELALKGDDLTAAGVPHGPRTGQILRELLKLVWSDPKQNNRDALFSQLKKIDLPDRQ
ncbi:MAG: CCA tRNA nucleotidyltransferase [Oscillospiraceae bacterium]|nr:CCA tRNA nucleotidyltransferase [Oscillospiraceae bacterium]